MTDQPAIAVFVKLGYWEVYEGNVAVLVRQFRKLLIIFGVVGVLTLALFTITWVHPKPDNDWYQTMRDSEPLLWVFGIPILIVFVTPLLGARRVLSDERIKKGISYRFSESGVHVESSVAISDLQWAAFQFAIETRSLFLLLPSRTAVHILPIRCFASPSELAAMRKLLQTNVPKTKFRLY